jgi:hypothetical protein
MLTGGRFSNCQTKNVFRRSVSGRGGKRCIADMKADVEALRLILIRKAAQAKRKAEK